MIIDRIKEEVPEKPGCYIYFNKNNEVIYVGKAKNLKKRMTSYFNRSHNIKTQKLVSEIFDFKNYITTTEQESLILERNLIRKYNPRYNILLKDDKNYPYILVTNEKHPRVLKVRDKKISGEYFGPYPNLMFVSKTIEYINKKYKLRLCTKLPDKECLYYYLNQCYAPCIKSNDPEIVKKEKNEVLSLLRNNMKKLKSAYKQEMNNAAKELNFETASEFRDLIKDIDDYSKRQAVQLSNQKTFDVINYVKDDSWISIAVVSVKQGIVDNITTSIQPYYDDYKETVVSYLYSLYESNSNDVLIEDVELKELVKNVFVTDTIESHLSEYATLNQIAFENANNYYKNNIDKITKLIFNTKLSGFEELKKIANNELHVIELYDISHNQGESQVAGKVVYVDGRRQPKLYRKYRIKEANKKDEYGSMREVLRRRLTRMIESGEHYPDLIILDGGKAHVSVGKEILKEFYLEDQIMLIGLVKDDSHRTRAIINKNYDEFNLQVNSRLYKFLFDMQEEVHRYAISYHRTAQKNKTLTSVLDNIDGLGPKRKKLLFNEFKTIENIRNATEEELVKVGIPSNVAKNISFFLKNNKK